MRFGTPLNFWLLTLVYVAGSRFAIRGYFQWLQDKVQSRQSVIIYGAGSKGVELAKLLMQQGDHVPVAFVDDAKNLHKRMIHGLYVYPPKDMGNLLRGDLGESIRSPGTKVTVIITRFLPWTLFSLGVALIISFTAPWTTVSPRP